MESLENIIGVSIPIFICVILPVAIVAIKAATSKNKDNQRTKIMLAMIEKNPDIDIDKMKDILQSGKKSFRGQALSNLRGGLICIGIGVSIISWRLLTHKGEPFFILVGGIILAVGIALVVMYFITMREAEREESTQEEIIVKDCDPE